MTNENNTNTVDAKELNLTLTVSEINLVLGGLGELPAKMSINLIDKIRTQATAQLQQVEGNA